MKFNFLKIILLLLILPISVQATIGVGVGTGKISYDEPLKPGAVYQLPTFTVFNTGTETSNYEVAITYQARIPELRPQEDWFEFTPKEFSLEPKQSIVIDIQMTLPLKTEPGDYFAYVEARPVVTATPGTSIGVAAASKLNFSVAPANIFSAVYYRVSTFITMHQPWSNYILIFLGIAITLFILSRFVELNIGFKKKP